MVWLNTADAFGNGLYLNIHRIEQREGEGETLFAVHGTVGDGFYEGEVLLEIGRKAETTFADQWLDPEALAEFFGRAERSRVESALEETAASMVFCVDNFPSLENRPRREVIAYRSGGTPYVMGSGAGDEQMVLPLVGETPPRWEAA